LGANPIKKIKKCSFLFGGVENFSTFDLINQKTQQMKHYNFPIYTSHDNGTRLVKHINPSKCISVYVNSIRVLDFTNKLSDEQSTTSNYWDELIYDDAIQVSKEYFDKFRKEVINQLINY